MGAELCFRGFSLGGWGQPEPLRPERHPLRSGFELMPVCWTGGRSAARVVSLRISSTAFAGLSADAISPVFAPLASLTIGAENSKFKVQSSKFGANATREGIPAKTGARRASRTSPKNREHSNNRTSAHYGCTPRRHPGRDFSWH